MKRFFIGSLLLTCSTLFAHPGKIYDIQIFNVKTTSDGATQVFAQIAVLDGTNAFPYALPLVDKNGNDVPGAKYMLTLCQQALSGKNEVTLFALNEGGGNPGDAWAFGASDLFPNGYSKPLLKKVIINP